jgi:hypothetical protein
MSDSFEEYVKSVFKEWWLLVVDIVGGALFITGLLGKTVPITLPIGLAIIFLGLSIAQFLAYHELRKTNLKFKADLAEAKMYESKSQRIEIISKEKYPSEILRILDNMRGCLTEIIEGSDNVQDITTKKILDSVNGDPHDLYEALNQKSIADNVRVTFSFYRNFRLGIGLYDLQEKNSKWKALVEDLEKTKKDIPDQELKDAVITHFMALNGDAAIRLCYRYLRKYGANQMLVQVVEPFRPLYGLLDETMTRVTKRILELKLGEEPKWEMKYINLRGNK